ncbi:MAG: AEC family transporter [Burkholderiaceae bacterium]|nr:AEC family transporter [Burkholderiaceae bacterium]
MAVILNTVFPLFALILIGFLAARLNLLGADAVTALNKFVVWMALPALMFQAMAQISWEDINQPGYVAATSLSMALIFGLAYLLDRKRRLADISLEGLAASYSNTGYMGIPLALMVFGDSILPAVVIAMLLTACGLFAFSIALIEIDLQGSGSLWRTAAKVGKSLAINPLVAAPAAGLIVAAFQLPLPSGVYRFTTLLGAAASPCALVTIGLFLAHGQATRQHLAVGRIVFLKLILHPLLTFVLVRWVFDMPPMWANAAILLSALPVGTGPFMLAALYGREPAVTSRAILMSTVLSVVTVSVLLGWINSAG